MPNAKWDELDRYVVISADSHAGGEIHEYKNYLSSSWHDEFDAWVADYQSPFDDLYWATAKRNWDSDFRLGEIDADGVAAEVLFPNTIPPFFESVVVPMFSLPRTKQEFDRRWAGLQAHNRWMLDFCSKSPDRRRGVLHVFPHDVDVAMDEIRWAKEAGCFATVLIPSVPPNFVVEPFFHRRYEPLWSLCQELDFPVNFHAGSGVPDYPQDEPAWRAIMFYEFSSYNQRSFGQLILSGVFERFPALKAVLTEMRSLAWTPAEVERMDLIVSDMLAEDQRTPTLFGNGLELLSAKPSDYLRHNWYHGASLDVPGNYAARHIVGVDRVMWGSDYPHEEGSAPDSRQALRWLFADVPVAECRQMLAGNAATLYGFDLDALVPIAQRIGPRLSDVHDPLPGVTNEPRASITVSINERPFAGGKALARL